MSSPPAPLFPLLHPNNAEPTKLPTRMANKKLRMEGPPKLPRSMAERARQMEEGSLPRHVTSQAKLSLAPMSRR